MPLRMITVLVSVVLGAGFLSACGGSDQEVHTTTQTEGQELMDLQKARDSGAITEDEYEDQREAILDRYE